MASLGIRNLTINAIELVSVERFESEKVSTGNVFKHVGTAVTNFLNATTTSHHETHPKGSAHETLDVNFPVPAFQCVKTDVRAPDPGLEVIRLVFLVAGRRYETDVPSPSRTSAVMKPLDDSEQGLDMTVVYVPTGALVAVYSSAKLDSWMAELADSWPLSTLSIPGTHNSPTCHTALPSVRCQAVGVSEQLRNGVRFLDVRVSVSPESARLALVHSAFPVALTGTRWFADMLVDVYAFLDEHPSETLLMSVKREGTGKGSDEDLAKYLHAEYVAKRPERWFTEPDLPTLGRARGRIVIIRRFRLPSDTGWGVDASSWPDNCADGVVGGGRLRVQDFYEVTESVNIEKKLDLSRAHLERAAQQEFRSEDGRVPPCFVNFLSASNFFNATCWPERIAAKVNPAIVDYLCARHGEPGKGPAELGVGLAGTGVVVTDWVGANGDWDLIRCIVGMNARLQTALT